MRNLTVLPLTTALAFTFAGCDGAVNDRVALPSPSASASTSPTPTATTTAPPTPVPTATIAPAPTATTTPLAAPTTPPVPTTPPPSAPELLPPLFAGPVTQAERAVPIVGGTLLVTADGATAVAADPDRDRVFLVDLATRGVRAVATESGDEPGRVVEGAAGSVYVVARRAGAVLSIDLATASVTQRIAVCGSPRGLAYDATTARLHVACRSGELASIDGTSGTVVERLYLEEDLRDVIVRGASRIVTRFRSAEVLEIDAGGAVSQRLSPPPQEGLASRVLFRALSQANGVMLLAHQLESETPLPSGIGSYYGGSCAGGGVVRQAVTILPPSSAETPARTLELPGLTGPTDLAISPDGQRVAVLASGNSWLVNQEQPTMFVAALLPDGEPQESFASSPCSGAAQHVRYLAGEPVAVAFDASGRYLVQSREPALLEIEGDIFVSLSDDSRFDTGLATFYLNTGGNVSCASCHPEGGDDGHTWAFSSVGYRRSQSLAGGVTESAPFHWSGDLPTFENLFTEVMLNRMRLPFVPPPEHVAGLESWLDKLPNEVPAANLDPAAVERGRVLFSDTTRACGSCHSGPRYSDGRSHDVGTGGEFVTPPLRGVAFRAPYMHDGCATTLRARFSACGGSKHGDIAGLGEAELDDLITFMRSL